LGQELPQVIEKSAAPRAFAAVSVDTDVICLAIVPVIIEDEVGFEFFAGFF